MPREDSRSKLTLVFEGSRTAVQVLYPPPRSTLPKRNLLGVFCTISLGSDVPKKLLFNLYEKYPDSRKHSRVSPLGFERCDNSKATLDLSPSIRMLECDCQHCVQGDGNCGRSQLFPPLFIGRLKLMYSGQTWSELLTWRFQHLRPVRAGCRWRWQVCSSIKVRFCKLAHLQFSE